MQTVAFADGHVKLVSQSKLHANWVRTWNDGKIARDDDRKRIGRGYCWWYPYQKQGRG
jgi:hypothetical protein